jgi:outer membrane protein assembly factor BamB
VVSAPARSLLVAACLTFTLTTAWAGNWPQWRGPAGDGVSEETNLPLRWSEQSNVVWKCPLPGDGASTPAIWGNAVFVTAQEGEGLTLSRINKSSGQVEWTRQVGSGTPSRGPLVGKSGAARREQKFHRLHNMASPSPVTDGELIVVHFGNGDLAVYDFAGQSLWSHNLQKEHGKYSIWWGHANSPVLYRDLVISVCMQDSLEDLEGEPAASYLVAYDKRTGAEKWKSLRKTQAHAEQCDAYTTPILVPGGDGPQLVVMGGNQIDAYDPATGRQLWFLPGLVGGRTITGSTFGSGLVYTTQGMRGPLLAVRPEGTGQLPAGAVVWKQTQGTPDSSTPVVSRGLLFWIADNGITQCRDAATGAERWRERLPGDYKASPLAAEGRIYFLSLSGLCTVVAAGPRFEKLAENHIADETLASPAVSDGRIYLRGRKTLYCIGAP